MNFGALVRKINNLRLKFFSKKLYEIDEGLLVRAGLGDKRAQLRVGVKYELNKDYNKAAYWYGQAVEQGDADAMCFLGQMNQQATGMEKNLDEAIRLYWLAINQNSATAMFSLATIFEDEPDHLNLPQAILLYGASSDMGHDGAQNNLGVMYQSGKGVVKNYELSYFWFCISAANGNEKAASNRDLIENVLSKDQITAIQERAKNLFPQYIKR